MALSPPPGYGAPMQPGYATQPGYSQVATTQPVYSAPPPQVAIDYNLETIPGVIAKQTTQIVDAIMQSVGGAYEAMNKYHVKAMPVGKSTAMTHGETGAWMPTSAEIDALPPVFFVQESSNCCARSLLACCGGLHLRGLKLHYYVGNTEQYTVERPCKCGGCCGCPLEMTLYHKEQGMYGMVEEDFRCSDCCCRCIARQKVLVGTSRQSLVHKYSLVNSSCCCGRVNNCCGASCCKPAFFIDIVEPDGNLVGAAQKTYGGGECCSDCCRSAFDFNNYLLPFPPKATHAERMLLLTGLLSVEYAYHSRRGGEYSCDITDSCDNCDF